MRSSFSSTRFVRLLGASAAAEAHDSAMDVAERLGLWLNAFDAIRLQAAHQSIRAIAPGQPAPGRRALARVLAEDIGRTRGALAGAIAREVGPLDAVPLAPAPRAGRAKAAPAADAAGYAPYRQRHLELQRQMEQMLGPLREHVREALHRASPRLRQLAALDAVFEQVLAPREQLLLPRATGLLERRFEQLHRAHREQVEASGAPDDPALWRAPGGWLDVFGQEWRQALLAELDLRLEPVTGLVDAVRNEFESQP